MLRYPGAHAGHDLLHLGFDEYLATNSHARPLPAFPRPITQAVFPGTAGNDSFFGTNSDDIFSMADGGRDVVRGRAGNDSFDFGATLTASDRVDGGSDTALPIVNRDRLYLTGDYSGGLVFNTTTVVNVEDIVLGAGFSYSLTTNNATIAAGAIMIIDGSAVGAGETLTVKNSAETDGTLIVWGGAGLDRFTGGPFQDIFYFGTGALTATDRLDGGGDSNTLQLDGNYSDGLTFGPNTIRNFYDIYMLPGHDYNLTMNDANVASGGALLIYGPTGAGDHLIFDGSDETNAHLDIQGGPGVDTLTGGRDFDNLRGNGGADRLTGGPGDDFMFYLAASDSTSKHYDTVVGADFDSSDGFFLWFAVTGVDSRINHGTLSTASFDADLASRVDASHLVANHAMLFKPDAGTLAGTLFLVIDVNGVPGYQAHADLVIALENPQHISSLNVGDFTSP